MDRYPVIREGHEVYVLREHLTIEERRWNVERIRREAAAKDRHADALAAETEDLVRQGKLSAAVTA